MANRSLMLLIFLVACASGHCRKEVHAPPAPEDSADEVSAADKERVLVFKYDGSVSCGTSKGTSLEDAKAELKNIPVFSQSKRHDALLHPKSCGSRNGIANVYEISVKDLAAAQQLGFKKWNY